MRTSTRQRKKPTLPAAGRFLVAVRKLTARTSKGEPEGSAGPRLVAALDRFMEYIETGEEIPTPPAPALSPRPAHQAEAS